MFIRVASLVAWVLGVAALGGCLSVEKPPAAAGWADGGLPAMCVDGDGDGFGVGCGAGLDCDDGDAATTNECRGCAEDDTGCACDGSVVEEDCYLDPVDVGGRPICHEGTRYCRDGAWTACLQLTPYALPGSTSGATTAALVTGPVPCNPCNPSCYSTTDTPGPGDVATSGSGVVYTPTPGGITLPGSVTMVGLVDTDGDGVPDVYDSAPMNAAVTGFAGAFFHVLPLGATALDPLTLSVRMRTADIYILMDTTGSMAGEIANLRASISGTIIPQVRVAIPDAWFGVGDLQEYPVDPYGYASNFPYRNRLDMTSSITAAQTAVNALTTNGNITWPESSTQALYSMATGNGLGPYYPARTTCPAGTWGYPCFRDGTVPIVVLLTDAGYMNGPTTRDDYDSQDFAALFALPAPMGVAGNETQATARASGDASTQSFAFSGSTCGMVSNYSGFCGSGAGGDAVFSFTLSRRAYVEVNTEGGAYDTVLSLRNNAFAQISCDDDGGSGTLSRTGSTLDPGTYYAIVDGYGSACGNYRLNISAKYSPPTYAETIAALNARDIRVIVVESSDGYDRARADADLLATATNTVGPTGTPLRYSISGTGAGLGTTVVDAIRELADYNRLDITARANDNAATVGFDERTFVTSIVAVSFPPGRCTGITGGVQFNQCLPGTTVNFQVNFRGVVAATATAQRFDFTIDVLGGGSGVLSTVPVTIVIPPTAPTYPVSGTYTRDYDATTSCRGTELPRWRNLSWTATFPTGTGITWSLRSAATVAALATATPVSFTAPASTSPQDVGARLLGGGVPATLPHLRLTATLNANPTRTSAPLLSAFNLLFDCVPGE